MKFYKTKLKNGLRLITVPMSSLESATVAIWTRVGSRHESEKTSGISHFLEHMAFKGGKKYPNAKAVSVALDGIGASYNAGTDKEFTNYYVKVRDKKLEKGFDVLSDMLLTPSLREEDINREKGVIIEEIGMYEDHPSSYVWQLFERSIFAGSPLQKDIIGTRQTVKSFNQNNFNKFRGEHYHANNMLITVAGAVTPKRSKQLAEKYFGSTPKKSKPKSIKKLPHIQKSPTINLLNQKREQTNLILGFPGFAHADKSRYIENILTIILGGGMSSRLFTEIREKRGLAYTVFAENSHYKHAGYFCVYAGVDPKKSTQAIKVILDELYNLANNKNPISAKELLKAKEYTKGHLALAFESTNFINSFYGIEELMTGKVRTPDEIFKAIDSITVEQITSLAKKIFIPKKLNLALIGPHKSKTEFEKIIQ